MTDHPKTDYHAVLEADLTAAGSPCTASEVHGAWAGFLCGQPEASFEQASTALTEVLSVQGDREAAAAFRDAFFRTQRELADEQFGFDLWLPDAEAPLAERAAALAHWCQGFLYGLGSSGHSGDSPHALEILRDLQAISQLDPAVQGEEAETALTELVEYVRVGAQLLFVETALERIRGKRDGG